MNTQLNYTFDRKSENYFDWLINRVKSVRYHEAESIIVEPKTH